MEGCIHKKIQSVKNEYSYVWGYLYDLDDNGIPELIISDWGSHDGESYTLYSGWVDFPLAIWVELLDICIIEMVI